MKTPYSVLGFYIVFMILLNIFSAGYGEAFVNNADFISEDTKNDYSGDIFTTLGFLLFANVPETSNIANAIYIYRLIYWLMVIPYTIIISFIIVELIIP